MSLRRQHKERPEKGYPWLYVHVGQSWVIGLLVTVIVIGTGTSFYSWYWQLGNDVAPDSLAGSGFAIAGTICIVLATTLYAIRRRTHKLAMGQLNASLNWHVFFAVMGIAFILMHSFGNFNAKTGTYALYGLIALIVSGFIGRMLDRLMPWLIANDVDTILTAQGEDRVAQISRSLQIEEGINHFMSNTYKGAGHPGRLMDQAKQHIKEIHAVERAMQREQFYRYVIRYWRVFHVALALLTIGLITWHLVYVGELLLHTFTRHG